jgi:hypothetical protein
VVKEVKEHIDQRIRDNRKVSTDENVSKMNITRGKKGRKMAEGSIESIRL